MWLFDIMPRICCMLTPTGGSLILLFLVTSIPPGAAIVGTLTPDHATVEVGSDLVLNCTLNASSNNGRTAQDVIWKHNSTQLSPDRYTSLSDTVSQLTLTNVTFSDTGNYWCLFPDDGFFEKLGSLIRVGIAPKPPLLECFIRNPDEYRCSWEEGAPTNLRTTQKFTFRYGDTWTDCPDCPDCMVNTWANTCFIPMQYNTGTQQTVRVTSSNALGEEHTQKSFHPINDVVVNPPRRLTLQKEELETSLSVAWSIPDEWPRIETPLDYKIRYKTSTCFMTNHNCNWTLVTLTNLKTDSLEYTLRGLAPYTFYDVQMAARYGLDDTNWSEWTEMQSAVTREIRPTATVQDLQVIPDGETVYFRSILIVWQEVPPDQLNGDLVCYRIQITSDDATSPVVNTCENTEWYKVEDLHKFEGYTLKVAAKNGAGEGPWETAFIKDLTAPPHAPDAVRAVALTTTSIFVSWDEPSPPNSYIQNYTIEWGKTNGQKRFNYTTPDARTNHTIDGLKTFDLYEISVKARNSRGSLSGFRSVTGGVRTLEGVPDAPPTNVKVEPVSYQPDRLTLLWQRPPAEKVNGNLTGYSISFCESSPFYNKDIGRQCKGDLNIRNLSRPDAVSDTLNGLAPSTNYLVWIAGYTAVGMGPDSEPVQAETAQESQSIFILAIVFPILIGTVFMIVAFYCWKQCGHFFKPVPDPKFHKYVDIFKNDFQRISRSSSRMEEEHFDELLKSSDDVIIIGLLEDKIEVAKEASDKQNLILESVTLDPKTQTARFIRSESRDSGVPPSPASESPDFSILRDRLSSSEEGDDNVFLDEEDVPVSPSSPTEAVGAYTMVGQLVPSNTQTAKTSQSSPVKSPKKVSFEIPSSPNHKLTGVKQNASQDKQSPSHQSQRNLSSSSMDVSPYTQMSALESLQRMPQQTNQASLPQSHSTARTAVQSPSTSTSVSPYSQMSTHQQQPNQQPSTQPPSQLPPSAPVSQGSSPGVAPNTRMSAMASLQPQLQQKPEEVKTLQPNSPEKSSAVCSPYTQMTLIESLKLAACQSRQQRAHQPRPQIASNSPTSPPPVSPYTQVSLLKPPETDQSRPEPVVSASPTQVVSSYIKTSNLEPSNLNQVEADQPTSQSVSSSPNSLPAVSPYTQVSLLEPLNARQQDVHPQMPQPSGDQMLTSKSTPQAVSPYIKIAELAEKPIEKKPIPSSTSSPSAVTHIESMQPREDHAVASSQPHQISPGPGPQSVTPEAVSPYFKTSDMTALQFKPNKDQKESSDHLHPRPSPRCESQRSVSPPATSSYIQSLEKGFPQLRPDMQHQLPSVISAPQSPLGPISSQAGSPYTTLSDKESDSPSPSQPVTSPQHAPVSTAFFPYSKMSDITSVQPSNTTSYIGTSEELQSRQDQSASRQSFQPDIHQDLLPSASNGYMTQASAPRNPPVLGQSTRDQVKLSSNHQTPPRQDLSDSLDDNPVTSAVDPNGTTPGFFLSSGSAETQGSMQELTSSQGLISCPQPNLDIDSDSEDVLDGYSKLSASSPGRVVLGSGNTADQASDTEVAPYTQISRNEDSQPSTAPPQNSALSTPITDNTTDPQKRASTDARLDLSDVSSNVGDYSLVAAMGSLTAEEAAGDSTSPTDNHSDDSGYDNDIDDQSDNSPPQSLMSDYVQVGTGTHVHDGNPPPHPAPAANADIGNQLVTAPSDTQPIADYVQTGCVSRQRTISQV